MVYLLIVVVAVIVIAAIAYGTQRKSRDGVASFKRQIDALSPEARKPVVDQVQSVSDLRRSSDPIAADPAAPDAPATDAPETDAPETDAPETDAPGTGAPAPGANSSERSHDMKAADPADEPGDSVDGA